MSESFLHYVWLYQYFLKTDLCTTKGEPLHIFTTGTHNTNAGPDFLNARIKIGEVQWVGNVEIHIDASGWLLHKHDQDAAYENVILHVVWQNDKPVKRMDGSEIPTLELKQRVNEKLLIQYKNLINSPERIPCSSHLASISELTRLSTFDSMLTTRLQAKANEVLNILKRNKGDWEETCYQLLARNFGFKVNAEPFFQLAQAVPYKLVMKHADKLVQIEALLFGAAGFMDEKREDEYYNLLQREFNLLRTKYSLLERSLHKTQWKFLRLRPANFPTVRLAQFASLLFYQKNIFSQILTKETFVNLKWLFNNTTSSYWLTHYNFDKPVDHVPRLGESSMENMLINTVVPLYAAYALWKDEMMYMDRAVDTLQHIPAESNQITRQWDAVGIKSKTAFDTQALIELHNNFCSKRRCLDCNIGAYLLKPARHDHTRSGS